MKLRKETKAVQVPRHDNCPQCGQPIPEEPNRELNTRELIFWMLGPWAFIACLMLLHFYFTGTFLPHPSESCFIR